jgi:uncharacterized protein involved in exopolysaccharide biosynthesis
MRPYIETAFRHPLLLLVPAVLIPLLVAVGAYLTSRHYEVSAALWADDPSIASTERISYDSPAVREAQTFEERLSTESFRSSVIAAADLDNKVSSGEWPPSSGLGSLLSKTPLTEPIASMLGLTPPVSAADRLDRALEEVENAISIEARGDNLVRITHTGSDPEVGVALVEAAIEVYETEQTRSSGTQAQAILQFYERQVAERKEALEDASDAVQTFLSRYPAAADEALLPAQAQQLANLNSEDQYTGTDEGSFAPTLAQQLANLETEYDIQLSQYELALEQLGEAQLRADTDVTASQSGFLVVDPPTAPDGPTLDVSRAVTLVFMGIVFGVGVGGVLVVMRTWWDQTLRRAEDVEQRLRVPVLASLPRVKRGV